MHLDDSLFACLMATCDAPACEVPEGQYANVYSHVSVYSHVCTATCLQELSKNLCIIAVPDLSSQGTGHGI